MRKNSNKLITVAVAVVVFLAVIVGGGSSATAAPRYPAPSGLTAVSAKAPTATLVWNKVAGGSRYRVAVSTRSNMSGAKIYRTKNSTAKIKVKTKYATRYYVKVRSLSKSGKTRSKYSAAYVLTIRSKKRPATPQRVKVTRINSTSVTVSWAKVSKARKYRVYYRQGAAAPVLLSTGKVTSASIEGLQEKTAYTIYVKAVDRFATLSRASKKRSVTTSAYELAAPTAFDAVSDKDRILAGWNEVPGATNYRIVYATGAEPATTKFVPSGNPLLLITNLRSSTTYQLYLQAMGDNGERSPQVATQVTTSR